MNKISQQQAKNIWIQAQKLNEFAPFGAGSQAVANAVQHLGYVQIDTINVIERCHHHILYNRIPGYKLTDLHQAQSKDKSIFEYWTHALAYLPSQDFKYFASQMKDYEKSAGNWFRSVKEEDKKKVLKLLKQGPVSIRDIKDDVLVEKTHPWGSTKPSKKALQLGFYSGQFTISERDGMLKKYELTKRHFGWAKMPKGVCEGEYMKYVLERSIRSQGLISIDSTSHLEKVPFKKKMRNLIEKKVKAQELIEIQIDGFSKIQHWMAAEFLQGKVSESELTHILSPFDPLTIQRKRLKLFFDYDHVFEAYIPIEKRKYGYFGLPVLIGNNIVAVLDLKTDRQRQELLIQKWTWLKKFKSKENKKLIEAELERFEKFQLQSQST